ncbi:MAG: thiamine phosphate synthase [Pseudomonadota bacterium]
MPDQSQPQIYLITPRVFDLNAFDTDLARLLDALPVACVRLRSGESVDALSRAADALRDTCHGRDVALVLEGPASLAQSHGLDGVHLPDGARSIRAARKTLEDGAIVGAFCDGSRHTGLSAGEAGADYVAFGPVTATGLSHQDPVDLATFAWWSEMIELPVVAEGGITLDAAETLAPVCDFLALGPEIWAQGQSAETALREYVARIT